MTTNEIIEFLKEKETDFLKINSFSKFPGIYAFFYIGNDFPLLGDSVSKHQIIFGVEYVNWEGLGTGRIKWNKGVAEGISFKPYEMAYCSFINYEMPIDLLWAGMQQAKSITEPMTSQGNKKLNEKRIHPCHKPIMLYDIIYQTFGFEYQRQL